MHSPGGLLAHIRIERQTFDEISRTTNDKLFDASFALSVLILSLISCPLACSSHQSQSCRRLTEGTLYPCIILIILYFPSCELETL